MFFAPSVVIPVSFKDPQAIKTIYIYTAYSFLDWFKSASLANRKCHNKIFIFISGNVGVADVMAVYLR